jgi:hypothetical protein
VITEIKILVVVPGADDTKRSAIAGLCRLYACMQL